MMESLVVLYEDAGMVVVDKPAGLHTAPLRAGETGTLLGLVIERYPEVAALPGLKAVEPGLVHRLDRDTSGCVVVARTAEAFQALHAAFREDRALKVYTAACAYPPDAPPEDATLRVASRFAPYGEGRRKVRVVLPGGRAPGVPREVSRDLYATEARIIGRADNRLLVAARIRRGFRHQVRAHLAQLGLPILGDPLYGVPVPPGYPQRMYLHASRIELPDPATGARIVVESPLPQAFKDLFPGLSSVERSTP